MVVHVNKNPKYLKSIFMKFLFIGLFLTVSTSLLSQTTISFDNPNPSAPTSCNDSWTESGIPQQLVPIPPATTCSFDYSSGDLWLFPAKLTLDLSSLNNISSVEVDIIDWCDIGCSNVDFFQNGNAVGNASNTTSNVAETIIYNNTAMDDIDEMTVQSFENQIFEIRIITETICDQPAVAEISVANGDIYLEDACNGIILTSPDGSCYRVTIDNNGVLSSAGITCP